MINEALAKHGRFNEDGLNVLASRTCEPETGPVTVGAGQAVVEVDAVVTTPAQSIRGHIPPEVRSSSLWTGLDDAGITEARRVREAKKAVTAAEKTLRDARRLERLAAREAREGCVARARVESTAGGCVHFLPNTGLGRQIWQPEG